MFTALCCSAPIACESHIQKPVSKASQGSSYSSAQTNRSFLTLNLFNHLLRVKIQKKMFRLFIVRLICRSYLLCKGSSSSFFTSSVISLFVTVMPVVTSSQLMSGNRTGPHGIFVFEFWFSRLTVRIGRTFLQPKGDDSICIGRTTIEIKNANCFIFLVQLHFYNVPFGK